MCSSREGESRRVEALSLIFANTSASNSQGALANLISDIARLHRIEPPQGQRHMLVPKGKQSLMSS